MYGGTYRLLEKVRKRSAGLQISFIDFFNIEKLTAAIRPETRLVWVETPTNPLLKLVNLEAVAAICQKHRLISVADNTFATPILQRPLEKGFDIVIHSVTKYLNGHSDMVGGMVVTNNSALSEQLAFLQNAIGAVAGPFDSFLALRGIKTLALRMEKHCQNAFELAAWLTKQPKINHVIYPGLPHHPQHKLAREQMQHFGGMISVELNCGEKETLRFFRTL